MGDEFHVLEEQKMERRVRVPWAFRANEILATWIGMQMGISSWVHVLIQIAYERHHPRTMQRLLLSMVKMNPRKNILYVGQSVK